MSATPHISFQHYLETQRRARNDDRSFLAWVRTAPLCELRDRAEYESIDWRRIALARAQRQRTTEALNQAGLR